MRDLWLSRCGEHGAALDGLESDQCRFAQQFSTVLVSAEIIGRLLWHAALGAPTDPALVRRARSIAPRGGPARHLALHRAIQTGDVEGTLREARVGLELDPSDP